MILITKSSKEDINEVVSLINHVFGKGNDLLKMEDIFPDLLCEHNLEHMRIIKVNGKPVSVINYIINEIDINGCIIKAASIGSVCTHEDYRRRGYSNLILRDCLENMKRDGVDFLYVSGRIGLYTKNDIHIAGKMYNFNIDRTYLTKHKELFNETCEVKECSKEDFYLLFPFYDAEPVKFIRDKQRFLDLANRVPSATVVNNTAKFFRIEQNGQTQGYFIGAVNSKDNCDPTMEIIEYAGKRTSILAGIVKVLIQLSLTTISGYTLWFDADMVKSLKEHKIETKICNYPGTMKIINFHQFMQKLRPLYAQERKLESMEFCESDGKYFIRSSNMELVIKNDKAMHNLFLGDDMELLDTEQMIGDDSLVDILKSVLPIPVPYPYNLNYI